MTREQIQAVIQALASCADTIEKGQLKQIYRILIANGRYPLCPACHQPITDINDFTWDHILPHSKGGSNDLYNLQPMHYLCNLAKDCKIDSAYLDEQYELSDEIQLHITQRKRKRNHKKSRHVERLKAWHCANSKNGRRR